MRTLTGKMGINEETFEPVLMLMLDGVETGTSAVIEALSDISTLHGPDAEQAFIDMVVDELANTHNLTEEEVSHYSTNFKSLVLPT